MLLTMQKYLSLPWNKKKPHRGVFLREQSAESREQWMCPPMADTLHCHSCAGRNRDYAVRAYASQTQNVAVLFDKGYQAVFAEYCITVNGSNLETLFLPAQE